MIQIIHEEKILEKDYNIGIEQLENENSLRLSQLGWVSLAEQTLQNLWNNKNDMKYGAIISNSAKKFSVTPFSIFVSE